MQKTLRRILCTMHKNIDKIVCFDEIASPFYGASRAFFSEKSKSVRRTRNSAGEGTFAMPCGDFFEF